MLEQFGKVWNYAAEIVESIVPFKRKFAHFESWTAALYEAVGSLFFG